MRYYLLTLFLTLAPRFLGLPIGTLDQDTERWLADSWPSRGFQKYIAHREQRLRDELANGIGMKEHARDDYIRYTGQRVENLYFALKAKAAFKVQEEKRNPQPRKA